MCHIGIITAMIKNKPAAEVPTPHELELGWYYTMVIRIVLHQQTIQSQVFMYEMELGLYFTSVMFEYITAILRGFPLVL
jgi:hypothetical protein